MKCKYNCGKELLYNKDLPSPPFQEEDTGIHHTFKRCAELLGTDRAKAEFSKDAKQRKLRKTTSPTTQHDKVYHY